MPPKSDAQLFREYAETGAEFAFTEIVTRHTNLVYSAAMRLMNSPDMAAEVTQSVFIGLARGARALAPRLAADASLAGWLCRSARNQACNLRRNEFRQHSRERQAMEEQNPIHETMLDWEHLRPVLDEAMSKLTEPDYDALVMRYYNDQDLRSIGQALGVSEDTAQKRVSRALEKLREHLAKHGIRSPAAALSIILSANAVQAAPAGLAVTISTAAILAGTPIATIAAASLIKTIAMTTLQKSLITVTIVATVGVGIYQTRQATVLRGQVQTLQRQKVPLAGQVALLKTANENLSNQLTQTKTAQALSKAQFGELMKLRGQIGPAREDSRQLAKLKSDQSSGKMPDFLTNAMASRLGMAEKFKLKEAKARVGRMTKALNLTDDQAQAISALMQKQIQDHFQWIRNLASGNSSKDLQKAVAGNQMDEEAGIQALLTPGQLAAYPQFQQTEKTTAADDVARGQASQIADDLNLSKDQQEKIRAAFYQLNLNQPDPGLAQATFSSAKTTGDFMDASIELQKKELEEKVTLLGSILTPEQTKTYGDEQMDRINAQASAMKMLLPQKTAATPN